MATKRKKYRLFGITPNSASIFYLYEVNAIPPDIRKNYLYKLLKRKNAQKQKNVKLLKLLYSIVEKKDFNSWDPEYICKTVDINNNQLYWHKSKILKDLREMFFGWNKIEQEIMNSSEIKGKNEEVIALIKARKMYDIGMVKEAKRIYLRYSKNFEEKARLSSKEILIYSEVLRKLKSYYYFQRNLDKFNKYLYKLEALYAKAVKRNLPEKGISLIEIRLLLSKSNKISFDTLSSHVAQELDYLKKALVIAKRKEFVNYQLEIMYDLGFRLLQFQIFSLKNIQEAKSYFKEGLRISKENGFTEEELAFNMELLKLENNNEKNFIPKLTKSFSFFKEKVPGGIWTIRILSLLLDTLIRYKYAEYKDYLFKLTNLRILRSFKASAYIDIFINKSIIRNTSLFNIGEKNFNDSTIIILSCVDYPTLRLCEFTDSRAITIVRSIHFFTARLYLLIDLLSYNFLKGKDFDHEESYSLIRRIDWAIKYKEISNPLVDYLFPLLKIGIKMFDETSKYKAKELIIEKYMKDFSAICNKLIQSKENSLSLENTFLYITHVAQQLNYPGLWEIVERQWNYLQEHHPLAIESLKKQYEEQQSRRNIQQEDKVIAA